MPTLLSCLSAATDSPALIIPGESPTLLSHQELSRQVRDFQTKLAGIGITKDDKVATAFPNSLESVVAFLTTSLQRAAGTPLNPDLSEHDYEFSLRDLETTLILVPKGAIDKNGDCVRAAHKLGIAVAEVHRDRDEIVLEMGKTGSLEGRQPAAVEEEPSPDDVALIMHTSGTAGPPKAVALTHNNLTRAMINIQNTYGLTAFDRTLVAMPLSTPHGLITSLLAPLLTGGSAILPSSFSPDSFWHHFTTHEATWYSATPSIHRQFSSQTPEPVPPIRFIRSAEAPLSPSAHKALEISMNAPVLEAYTMTETCEQIASNPLPPAARKSGSVGLPQGISVKIISSGEEVATGEVGEICVAGETVASHYLHETSLPIDKIDGTSYFRTGDQGYMDKDGYLFLTGRISELIVTAEGKKISPIELDNIFSMHPLIVEAVSFGIPIPHEEGNKQDVAVAVVLKEGAQLEAGKLREWFRGRAAEFKRPTKIFFNATMPRKPRREIAQIMLDAESAGAASVSSSEASSSVVSEGVNTPASSVLLDAHPSAGPEKKEKSSPEELGPDDEYEGDYVPRGDEKWLERPRLSNRLLLLLGGIKAAWVYATTGVLES